jgi:hypothetical protein
MSEADESGGEIIIKGVPEGLPFRWFNPVTGAFTNEGKTTQDGSFNAPGNKPWVLVIGEKKFEE